MHACFFVMLYCVCELCVVSLLRLLQFMLCLAISRRVWPFSSHVDDSSLYFALGFARGCL